MARRRSMRARVAEVVEKSREFALPGPDFEALALIAEELADAAERTAPEDAKTRLAVLRELRTTLGELTGAGRDERADAGAPAPPGGRDDAGSGPGGIDRELADLMGSGPVRSDS